MLAFAALKIDLVSLASELSFKKQQSKHSIPSL